MEMSHGTKNRRWSGFARWGTMVAVILAGCSSGTTTVKMSCTQNSDGSYSCTNTNQQLQDGVAPQDLTAAAGSNSVTAFRLILNLPSDAVLNTHSPVQATLSATTDRGYTAAITVTLQQTTSTTQPVAPGDTVYTFLLPNTSEVSNWAASVAANANSSINVTSSSVSGMNLLGNPGSYTATIQEITEQTGLTTVGSVGFTDPGPSSGNPCPSNRPCPVVGSQN